MTDGEQISRDQEITRVVQSDGWKYAMEHLSEFVQELGNIGNVEAKDADKMFLEVQARKSAMAYLIQWKKEIEGVADRHADRPAEEEEDSHIRRA